VKYGTHGILRDAFDGIHAVLKPSGATHPT